MWSLCCTSSVSAEDKRNPVYRRVCYTFAWSAVITFAVLNAAGLLIAAITGKWYMLQSYRYAYLPIALTVWLLVRSGSTRRE